VLRLGDVAPEFGRHGFRTSVRVEPLRSPVEAALGASLSAAPAAVRATHRAGPVTRLRGDASVEGAATPVARLIARLFGLPPSSRSVSVRVTKRLLGGGIEEWERDFAGQRMTSRLRALGPGRVRESFGPFHFDLALTADAEGVTLRAVAWRLGPLAMPSWLAPRSIATEKQDANGRFCFDVPIELPLIGRLTHYSGHLVIEELDVARASAEKEDA
jgi:hypothetical protein